MKQNKSKEQKGNKEMAPKPFLGKECSLLLNGDCVQMIDRIPDGSVSLILTDPPYNLGSSCMTVGGFQPHKFAWLLFYGLLSRSSGPRNFD